MFKTDDVRQVTDKRMKLIARYDEFTDWMRNFDFDTFFNPPETQETESEVA